MVANACKLSTWEADAGGPQVQGQPGCVVRPCLKKRKERERRKRKKEGKEGKKEGKEGRKRKKEYCDTEEKTDHLRTLEPKQ
jgi:hypothetical protein